ncbi:TPA: hypothetical protein PMC30_003735 [Vibrio cholerae]|nr:hypothetical protein [Vibrio cholerae]HDI3272205.1 hypothetical protein [Vibrio cholerae]
MKIIIEKDENSIASESGNFCKWIRKYHGDWEVVLPESTPKRILNDSSLILPLVTLLAEPDLLNYLKLVTEYFAFRFKGDLQSDRNVVNVRCIVKTPDGYEKHYEFNGPESAFREKVQNFDINGFYKE